MNRISNLCFICDHIAKPLNGDGSFNQKSCIFQKLNIKISNLEADVMDVVCGNCTVILNEIDALRTELNLLSYLVNRQIRRKYKAEWRHSDDQPKIGLLNKLDLVAVKSFKLLSNEYVCVKCNFRTPFQDTLVPHFKFHTICEKVMKSKTIKDDNSVQEDDLIEYDSEYEDQSDVSNVIVNSLTETVIEAPIQSDEYTEPNPPGTSNEHLEFKCPLCTFKNSEYENLTEHMNKKHPEGEKTKFSSCHNCGCLLRSDGPCEHQKAIEKGFEPKNCLKCQEVFYMDHLLHEHSRRIHLKCDVCDKAFSNFRALRRHEYTHKNGATYKCSDCGKTFKTRSGLSYHLPKHTGNYLLYCNVCNKGFMNEKFLEEHMGIHTKNQKYECDVCGTKFVHNSTYRLHRLWHDNPFPFDCTDCGKKFRHTSKLAVHRRREHTGERPYKCDVCEKTFFETTSLRSHQRIHAEIVTHTCQSCNMSFNSKPRHIQHMQKNHSRDPNLPKQPTCKYKVVLKPEFTTNQMKEPSKSTEECNADYHLQNNMIEESSNNCSNFDDNFIYKILL